MSFNTFLKNSYKEQIAKEAYVFQFGILFFNLGLFLLVSAPILGVLSILISLLLSFINRKNSFNTIKRDNLFFLVSIILLLNTIYSIFFKINQFEDWHFSSNILGLFNWLPLFFVFYFIQPYLKNSYYRTISIYFLLIGTFPLIVSGLGEYYLGWENKLSTLYGNIIWFFKPRNELKGLSGLFNNSNYAASWLTMMWPLAIGTICKNKFNKFKIIFFTFYSSIILYTTLLTNSKDTLVSLFFPIFLIINRISFKFSILFFISILVTFLYKIFFINLGLNSLIMSIWNPLSDSNLLNILKVFPRIDIWRVSIIAIFNKPILGWGASSFPLIYEMYKNKFIHDPIFHTHNLFLETSINYGLIFSILLFLIFAKLLINSWRLIFVKGENIINKCWWISTFIFIFNHMFDLTYYDIRISLIFWIMLAGLNTIINEKQLTINN